MNRPDNRGDFVVLDRKDFLIETYSRTNLPTGEFWKEYFVKIDLTHDYALFALKTYGFCFVPGNLKISDSRPKLKLTIGSQVILCCGEESITAYVMALQPQTNGLQGLICGLYRIGLQSLKPIALIVGFFLLKSAMLKIRTYVLIFNGALARLRSLLLHSLSV